MKNTNLKIAVPIAALVALLAPASSSAANVAVDYSLDFNSAYVWRGVSVVDGAVWQPSIGASHESGFSVNVWGNYDISNVNGFSNEFTEVDFTVDYAIPTEGKFGVNVGLIEYLFPGTIASTTEAYVSFSYDAVVAPALNVYYDFDQVDDIYADLSVGWSADINDNTTFDLSALAGYAGTKFAQAYGGTESGFFNGQISAGIGYSQDWYSIGAFVAYTESLDKDVLPTQPVDFYGGISFGFSF